MLDDFFYIHIGFNPLMVTLCLLVIYKFNHMWIKSTHLYFTFEVFFYFLADMFFF